MVSFQCETCGDVLPQKKLDAHFDRCWNTSLTCLDCRSQFGGQTSKAHTNCVIEDQKVPSKHYKDKKRKPSLELYHPPTVAMPRTPYQAYVKDADEEPTPPYGTVAQVHVPPRAPSPPSAAIPPVNVFDFLVSGSVSPSSTSSQSTYASDAEDSDISMSPEMGRSPASPHSPSELEFPEVKPAVYPDAHYSYGSGPIEISNERFNSEVDLDMQIQRVEQPPNPPQLLPPISMAQTPGPAIHSGSPAYDSQLDSRSDKKRKRPEVEDLDLVNATGNQGRAILHSGLTGGLMKMVNGSTDHSAQASPLSPKKRSKHSKELDSSKLSKRKLDARSHRNKERKDKEKHRHRSRHLVDDTPSAPMQARQERRSHRRQQRMLLEGRKDLKAIEYNPNSTMVYQNGAAEEQNAKECNSAYFLRLIDKDYRSVKGQSLWGLLKMFHEGRRQTITLSEEEAEEIRIKEERILLKGLRAKISKHGEIVLFSRPEAETEN